MGIENKNEIKASNCVKKKKKHNNRSGGCQIVMIEVLHLVKKVDGHTITL